MTFKTQQDIKSATAVKHIKTIIGLWQQLNYLHTRRRWWNYQSSRRLLLFVAQFWLRS